MTNYQKNSMKTYSFGLNTNFDKQLIDYLATITNKQAYMRNLITEDMERKGIHVENTRKAARDIRSIVHTAAFNRLLPEQLHEIQELIESRMAQPEEE